MWRGFEKEVEDAQTALVLRLRVEREERACHGGQCGESGWLSHGGAQLLVQAPVLRHQRVAVVLEKNDERLLQWQQRGVRRPQQLKTVLSVVPQNRVDFGHVVFETALNQVHDGIIRHRILCEKHLQNGGQQPIRLCAHGFVVLLQPNGNGGSEEREVGDGERGLEEQEVDRVIDDAAEGREESDGEGLKNSWRGEEGGRAGEECVQR